MSNYKCYVTDNSPRTTCVKRGQLALTIATMCVIVGLFGYIAGSWHYSNMIEQSSTAVGAKLKFKRSNAECQLSGLYTDKSQSVLIARLSFRSKEDAVKLPFRGTDYAVFVSSDALPNNVKTIDALTGRISSDGDMFIVLPRPVKTAVYSVFVMNTRYLGVGKDTDKNKADVIDINKVKGSLTAALTKYRYKTESGTLTDSAVEVESDSADVAAFRMTLSPAVDDTAHKPIALPVTLLNKSNVFDYKQFFKTVFIDNAKSQLEAQFLSFDKREKLLKAQLNEYSARLKENSKDDVAKIAYAKTNTELAQLSNERAGVAGLLSAYEDLVYSDSMFKYINNKAYVLQH